MTRALLAVCGVLLLSVSCGNSSAGNAATGGKPAASGTGTGGATTSVTNGSVTQWGGDIAHTGHWVNASLTKANMTKMAADTFTAGSGEYFGKFAGEIAAAPLFLAGASPGTGEYIAATTQNDVYAFNETSGALLWKHNVGANLGKGGSGC